MALDSATVTQLQTLQSQLQTKHDALTAQAASLANVMSVVAVAGLTPNELIQTKDVLFAGLPEAASVSADLARLADALSAVAKILAAGS